MAIPQGYRLLNESDVGKKFGIDLEQVIYFDTEANMTEPKQYALTWVGGLIKSPQAGQLTMVFDNVLVWDFRYESVASPYWVYDNYTVPSETSIESIFNEGSWNTFLYVKDIQEETTNDPYTITISNKSGITLLVEGKYLTKDITILLDKSLFGESGGGSSGGTNTWSVESVSGASYGFTLNSSGYYVSGNKGKKSSSAVCKVVLDIKSACKMYVDCINYAESSYDYGLLSNLDATFTTSATADTSNVFKSFKNLQSSNVVTVEYGTISVGSHSFYVKFVKDSSQDSNYDTLQFKVRLE